jgi:hypothetical protein
MEQIHDVILLSWCETNTSQSSTPDTAEKHRVQVDIRFIIWRIVDTLLEELEQLDRSVKQENSALKSDVLNNIPWILLKVSLSPSLRRIDG